MGTLKKADVSRTPTRRAPWILSGRRLELVRCLYPRLRRQGRLEREMALEVKPWGIVERAVAFFRKSQPLKRRRGNRRKAPRLATTAVGVTVRGWPLADEHEPALREFWERALEAVASGKSHPSPEFFTEGTAGTAWPLPVHVDASGAKLPGFPPTQSSEAEPVAPLAADVPASDPTDAFDAFLAMMRRKKAAHEAKERNDFDSEGRHLAEAARHEPIATRLPVKVRLIVGPAIDPSTLPELSPGPDGEVAAGPLLPPRLTDMTHVDRQHEVATHFERLERGDWQGAYEAMGDVLRDFSVTSEAFNSALPDVLRELVDTLAQLEAVRRDVPFEAARCDVCGCLFPRPDLRLYPQADYTRERCSKGCVRREQRVSEDERKLRRANARRRP